MDDTTPRPILLARLGLPEFNHSVHIESFDVRPDPAFPNRPNGDDDRGPPRPFTLDPYKGVLAFSFSLEYWIDTPPAINVEPRVEESSLELFVLRETLLDMIRDGEERLIKARETDGKGAEFFRVERTYHWAEWGEANTRIKLAAQKEKRRWVCYCSGYRHVSLLGQLPAEFDLVQAITAQGLAAQLQGTLAPSPDSLVSRISVLDFSPFNVQEAARQKAAGASSPHSLKVDNSGSTAWLVDDNYRSEPLPDYMFKHPVTSLLPYREVTRTVDVKANGVMMDDQRIILVMVSLTLCSF
jgi:hypothetical protein